MAGESVNEQRASGELGGMCHQGRNLCLEPVVGALMCKSCRSHVHWRLRGTTLGSPVLVLCDLVLCSDASGGWGLLWLLPWP